MENRTLKDRLKATRQERGLTQHALAKLAGCGQSLIGNLESGRHESSMAIPKIAAALNVSALWLSEGVGAKDATDPQPDLSPRKELIDTDLLHECMEAVRAWLASGRRKLDSKQRLELACHLYEFFFDDRVGVNRMVMFLDKWDSIGKGSAN